MIRIGHALDTINVTVERGEQSTFSITYVTVDGRVEHIEKASRGSRHTGGKSSGGGAPKGAFNMKEKGIIILYNHNLKRTQSAKIHLITHFNGLEVFH